MPDQPFRFLHASDFRLDAVPRGLSEVPDHLRDCLLDAPYTAARRVFDTAISERVAFVLLAGNILQAERTGPRGTAFLLEQFDRLAAAGIAVYWAASETDRPETWPAAAIIPKNVRLFARDHITEFLHPSDGPALVRIVGTSCGRDPRAGAPLRPADFVPDPVGLFSIAAACGEMEPAEMQSQGIHYWALGGRIERATLFDTPVAAHYPGTPQGRNPRESGARGCTLASVDERGSVRLTPVACSALQWHEEPISLDPSTRREDLETMCAQRIRALAEHSKCDLLVTWSIGGSGPLLAELRRGKFRGELLEWLRIEHGLSSPVVWTVGLEAVSDIALPTALYEQETLLGDYLRALREYEVDPQQPLDVESLLAADPSATSFARSVAISDAVMRKRVLHEAALLGIDLLSGEATS